MFKFIVTLAAAGAGYLLGSLGAKRSIDEQIDARFAELRDELQPAAKASAPSQPAPAPGATPSSTAESKPAPVPPRKAAKPRVADEEVSPEVLVVITAAICAFLGKPARIRRVRRLPLGGANPWAQVGRVNVMASHTLTRQH